MRTTSLGAHPDESGTRFAVWAPNATAVSVIGDFNDWGRRDDRLDGQGGSGVWAGDVARAGVGDRYKFRITTRDGGLLDKADPFAVRTEEPPATASIIDAPHHEWADGEWMATRKATIDRPISIYEVHLGSWGRTVAEQGRFPNYRELGEALAAHVAAHGFTHVELLPVMEHPFYGSWGYQSTGYFAPTARYGSPSDLMAMVDTLHRAGIGVLLDWVPSHFPDDAFALSRFDGTHLFEHQDPREGHHPDWDSSIFNYGRNEVRSFLISSAISWLDRYHVDGLRVDAVASMLYRDYSRAEGEWTPNRDGGRENLEAIAFLRQFNEAVYAEFPDVATFAEESTAFPGVSRPTDAGGLGFGYKWDMGWMHDTLAYLRRDPIHRRWHHDELTFRSVYAFSENYLLPLSHDEVVHGKGSLLDQMPGDRWQQLANLKVLYGYQWTQPGKKLLFMGGELAPERDWSHERTLDWSLHDAARERGCSPLAGPAQRAVPPASVAARGRLRSGGVRLGRERRRAEQRVRLSASTSCGGRRVGPAGARRGERHAGAGGPLPSRRAGRRRLDGARRQRRPGLRRERVPFCRVGRRGARSVPRTGLAPCARRSAAVGHGAHPRRVSAGT